MKLKPIGDQVVVIVGATSGIGRITAIEFVKRGAKVVLAARDLLALGALAEELTRQGGEVLAIPVDVRDYEQVEGLAKRAAERFGRIDSWVHLAAVSMYATFQQTRPEEFKQIIDVNLLGQVHGAMAALPYLVRAGQGALIHISSVEARRTLPLQSAYSASKHGMIGFLDSLRMELEHQGTPVSVANIMPASVNTPLFDKALTRLGVKPRPIPPVYHPKLVADAILYAAEHSVRDLYVGDAGKMLGLLHRISPRLGDLLLSRTAFRLQKSTEPKSDQAPNNLFQHLPGFDRVEGSFTDETIKVSPYTWITTRPQLKWGLAASLLLAGALVSGRFLQARRG